MVSEDFDHIGFGFSMVHGFSYFGDLDYPVTCQVKLCSYHLNTFDKVIKVSSLSSSQLILLKKWNDDLYQILSLSEPPEKSGLRVPDP